MGGGSNTSHSPCSAIYYLTCLAKTSRLTLAESNWVEVYSVVKGVGCVGDVDSSLRVPVMAKHLIVVAWSLASSLCKKSAITVQVEGIAMGGRSRLSVITLSL